MKIGTERPRPQQQAIVLSQGKSAPPGCFDSFPGLTR